MDLRVDLILLTVTILLALPAAAANYGKEMKKAVKAALREDFGRYQFLGTPITNFGVATMYPRAAERRDFDIKTGGLLGNPETWWVKQYSDQEKSALLAKLRPGGKTGKVALKLNGSQKFDLAVVLPGLYQLLSVSGGTKFARTVQAQITASNVENRLLDWSVLDDYRTEKLIKQSVLDHLDKGDYMITVGDVLLYDYSASLILDREFGAEAKAKLDAAWKTFSKDSGVGFDFSSGDSGAYALTAKEPVIAAVYVGVPVGTSRDNKQIDVRPTLLPERLLNDLSRTRAMHLPER